MNYINSFLSSELIDALGWTLLHSLWQGALISIVLAIILLLMRRFTAQTRYFVIMAAMITMLTLSVFTFTRLYQSPSQAVVTDIPENVITGGPDTDTTMPIHNDTPPIQVSSFESFRQTFNGYFNHHLPSIVTLWFLGMLIFLLKFLGGLAYTQRLKYYRTQPVPEEWQKIINRLCQKLKISRIVTAFNSGIARVPMVIGYLKPVILLPGSLFTGLTPQQLESILAHEVAHIARNDYLLNLLQSVIEIVYFYHPAVWWLSSCLRNEREHCCDDIAVKLCGDSHTFARTLADLQEKCLENQTLAMALTGSRNRLFQRIHRLVNRPKIKSSFGEGFFTALIIITCLTVMGFSMKKSSALLAAAAGESQADSTAYQGETEDSVQEVAEKNADAAAEKPELSKGTNEKAETSSEPAGEESILPENNFDELSQQVRDTNQKSRSASQQLSEDEQKIFQSIQDVQKNDERMRSKNRELTDEQQKALDVYRDVLKNTKRAVQKMKSEDILERFGSSGLQEPMPMILPEVDVNVNWSGVGGNKLIAAVKSGNIDSVRAYISEYDVNERTFAGYTALMAAAKTGNEEITGLLLEHNANPEIRNNENRTALWIAAYYGNTDIIKMLLDHKAKIEAKDNEGYTPLFAAIKVNKSETANSLLNEGADVNAVTFSGETTLIMAIKEKSAIANQLIMKGVDINRTDNSGTPPLLIALEADYIDIAIRLVKEGANVNVRDQEGESPLLYSIKEKHTPLAILLIESGADINHKNNYGETPLLLALDDELYELANTLIEKGADVNITDHRGNTPLMIAIKERLQTLAVKIIDNNADINKKNVQGETPLLYALYYDMNEIAMKLIEKGAELNVSNKEGLSPLAIAISDNKIELAHLMLEKGADANVRDEDGRPVLLTAIDNGLTETAKRLIDGGANINIADTDGLTPLLMAIDQHYVEICRLLIEKGADVNRKDSQNRTALGLAEENELYEISALLKEKGAKQ